MEAAALHAALPITAVAEELEQQVLPRFAAVFVQPRLRSAAAGAAAAAIAATEGKEDDFRAGPPGGSGSDAWLRRLTARLESDVVAALAASEHFRGVRVGAASGVEG
mgnify:CR=1 FL=1